MCVSGEGEYLEYLGISLYLLKCCLKKSRHKSRNAGSSAVQHTFADAVVGH